MTEAQEAITEALAFLKAARDRLKSAKASRAVTKTRAAITSAQNELERVK